MFSLQKVGGAPALSTTKGQSAEPPMIPVRPMLPLVCTADVTSFESLAAYCGVAIQSSMLYIQLKRSKQHRKVGGAEWVVCEGGSVACEDEGVEMLEGVQI